MCLAVLLRLLTRNCVVRRSCMSKDDSIQLRSTTHLRHSQTTSTQHYGRFIRYTLTSPRVTCSYSFLDKKISKA